MKNKVIYVGGKITGDPNYMEKFIRVANRLREMGFIPLLPTVLPHGMEHPQYMKICLPMIDVAAMVVFLPNWRQSIGATIEKGYCNDKRKPWIVATKAWESRVKNMMEEINND